MASSTSSFRSLLLLLLFSATAIVSAAGETMTHFTFYTSNVTTYTVTGLNLNSQSIFGDILVYDTPLTLVMDPKSQVVGRGQGLAVGTSMTDAALITALNFVFTDGEYKGSSLAVYGGTDGETGGADRPILGGTGVFRMAQGYLVSKIIQMKPYVSAVFDAYVVLYN